MLCHSRFSIFLQTDTIQYSGAYAALGVYNSLRFDNFCQNFKVEVNRFNVADMEFDMIGIDPALANAFRRILIAGVKYLCIFPPYFRPYFLVSICYLKLLVQIL